MFGVFGSARAAWLLVYMAKLLPIEAEVPWVDLSYRWDLADAIVTVTSDPEEQLLLARIPRFESAYRPDVGTCQVKGSAGEVTAWQVLARSKAERASLCVSYVDDARIALGRVRESLRACRHLPVDQRLAIYTRGRCDSAEGQRLSQHRYPGRRDILFFADNMKGYDHAENE